MWCLGAALEGGHVLPIWVITMQFSMTVTVAVGGENEQRRLQSGALEGQFLHEEVDSGVHLKAVKVVGVTL